MTSTFEKKTKFWAKVRGSTSVSPVPPPSRIDPVWTGSSSSRIDLVSKSRLDPIPSDRETLVAAKLEPPSLSSFRLFEPIRLSVCSDLSTTRRSSFHCVSTNCPIYHLVSTNCPNFHSRDSHSVKRQGSRWIRRRRKSPQSKCHHFQWLLVLWTFRKFVSELGSAGIPSPNNPILLRCPEKRLNHIGRSLAKSIQVGWKRILKIKKFLLIQWTQLNGIKDIVIK